MEEDKSPYLSPQPTPTKIQKTTHGSDETVPTERDDVTPNTEEAYTQLVHDFLELAAPHDQISIINALYMSSGNFSGAWELIYAKFDFDCLDSRIKDEIFTSAEDEALYKGVALMLGMEWLNLINKHLTTQTPTLVENLD